MRGMPKNLAVFKSIAVMVIASLVGCAPESGNDGATEQNRSKARSTRYSLDSTAFDKLEPDTLWRIEAPFALGSQLHFSELLVVAKEGRFAFHCEEALFQSNKTRASSNSSTKCPLGKDAKAIPLKANTSYMVIGYKSSTEPNYDLIQLIDPATKQILYAGIDTVTVKSVTVNGPSDTAPTKEKSCLFMLDTDQKIPGNYQKISMNCNNMP